MFFEYDFSIGLDDVDVNGNCKDKCILRFLENIACFHTDSVNRGINNIHETGKGWALLDWQVKVLKRPHYGQKIKVSTWGRKVTRTFVLRDYIIYADGEEAVYGTSKWFLLDLNRRMPMRITQEEMEPYEPEDKSILGIDDIEKIFELDSYDNSFECTVRKSEIDMLGHLHNTNYLDMIYEYIDDEDILKIKDIRISYKKEMGYGDKITILTHKENNKIYVAFKTSEGKTLNALAELS